MTFAEIFSDLLFAILVSAGFASAAVVYALNKRYPE